MTGILILSVCFSILGKTKVFIYKSISEANTFNSRKFLSSKYMIKRFYICVIKSVENFGDLDIIAVQTVK